MKFKMVNNNSNDKIEKLLDILEQRCFAPEKEYDEINSTSNLEKIGGDCEIIEGQFLSLQYCKNLKDLGKISLQSGNFDIYLKNSGITREYIEKEKLELLRKCIWY